MNLSLLGTIIESALDVTKLTIGLLSQRKEIKLMTFGERTQHISRMRDWYLRDSAAFDAAVPVKND